MSHQIKLPIQEIGRTPELLFSLAVVSLALSVGTIGYMVVEGWNAFDSFYMTVITLATIGYGETNPLSTAGRVFTIFLIFLGVGVGSVVLGTIGRVIIETQLGHLLNRRVKMQNRIEAVVQIYAELHLLTCHSSRSLLGDMFLTLVSIP